MRITFVRPSLTGERSTDAMQPLGLAMLSARTPADIDTRLYDERIESVPMDEPTDLAAITVETFTARRAYRIADEYRRRGVKVVMGGYHPTFLPDEALEHADAVVTGDAEGAWERVVDDARRQRLQGIYRAEIFPDLAGTAPDRGLFRGKKYAPVSLVQYGRGCRFNCDFCSIRAFYGSHIRQRPVREVVEEIERLRERTVFFVDDNLFNDAEKAKTLFRALIPLRIRWVCQVSVDVTRDPEAVRLMAESGCFAATIGFESLDEANLRQMRKRWTIRQGGHDTAVKVLRDAGIMIYGTFVFGYDGDTVASFDRALEFAIRQRFYLANFNPLTPTPGAPLYARLQEQGRLRWNRWWVDPTYRYGEATFHPQGMTADELTEGCYRARTEFNRYGSMLHRLLDFRTNSRTLSRVGLYMLSNRVSRREIHAKQGARLGGEAPLLPPAAVRP